MNLRACAPCALFGLVALVGCKQPEETHDVETAPAQLSLSAAAVRARAATRARLAHRLARDGVSDAQPIGGFIQIVDDQLDDKHSIVAADIFSEEFFPFPCFDEVPLAGGGSCEIPRTCTPEPPPFMGKPIDVGTLTVSSTYDTIQLSFDPTMFAYPTVEAAGPFWRGDGDAVTISFPGRPGVAAPFRYVAHAPVGDVIATPPRSPVDRTAPLQLTWDFANQRQDATGVMILTIVQGGAATATCGASIGQRSMIVPPSVLAAVQPGPGLLAIATVGTETVAPHLQGDDHAQLLLFIDGTVDVLGLDPADPTITFH